MSHAVVRAVSVLTIACPCALRLATPMSIMVGVGRGTYDAIASAGLTLVNCDLRGIVGVLRLSRAVMRNIRPNLFFTFIYNLFTIR